MSVTLSRPASPVPVTRPEWDFYLIADPSADGGYRSVYTDGSGGAYVPLRARAALGLA